MKNPISSNDPNTIMLCSKELKITDVENQFLVPTAILNKYPILINGHVSESITSYDKEGQEWIFPLAKRDGRYPKPTIPPASWHPFITKFGLGEGDAVVFYTRKDDAPERIQIRGMRKQIFLSKEIWVEVEKVGNEASSSSLLASLSDGFCV